MKYAKSLARLASALLLAPLLVGLAGAPAAAGCSSVDIEDWNTPVSVDEKVELTVDDNGCALSQYKIEFNPQSSPGFKLVGYDSSRKVISATGATEGYSLEISAVVDGVRTDWVTLSIPLQGPMFGACMPACVEDPGVDNVIQAFVDRRVDHDVDIDYKLTLDGVVFTDKLTIPAGSLYGLIPLERRAKQITLKIVSVIGAIPRQDFYEFEG